jgi:quercetin dioxygenase-like cupin family protein
MIRLLKVTVFMSFVAASLALASCAQSPNPQQAAAAQPAPAAAASSQPAAASPTTEGKSDEEIRDIIRIQLDKVTWTPTEGNTLGVESAVLEGDPKKPGYYLTVNHFPPGVMSRPHFHPDERHCIVIKGTWYTNTGDVFTTKGAVPLKPGDYMRHPKGVHHFDGALDDDVYVAIAGTGPGGITTVDGGPIFGRIKKGE